MSNFVSTENAIGFKRITLEPDEAVGVYVYVWETEASAAPERDYLQDTLAMAMEFCEEDFGVPLTSWQAFSGG